MSEPVAFPTTWQQRELLRWQQKCEELTKRRDRLNVRIDYLRKRIDSYWEPAQARRGAVRAFWPAG